MTTTEEAPVTTTVAPAQKAQGSFNAARAKVFGTPQKPAEKAPATSAPSNGEKATTAAPETKAEAPKAKPASIFDTLKPKGEEKPVVVTTEDPLDKMEPPAEAPEKTKTDWKTLKEASKAAKAAAAQATEELKKAREEAAALKMEADRLRAESVDLPKLREQVSAYSEKVKLLDVTSHPEFIEKYVQPEQALRAQVNEEFKTEGVEDTIESILGKYGLARRKALDAALENMTNLGKQRVVDAVQRLEGIDRDKAAAIANADATRAQFQQTGEQKRLRMLQEQRGVFDKVATDVIKLQPLPVPEDAQARAAAEIYNQSLASLRTKAEKIAFGEMSAEDMARASLKAATADFLMEQAFPRAAAEYDALREYATQLEKELEGIKKQKPGAGSTNGGEAPTLTPQQRFEMKKKQVYG